MKPYADYTRSERCAEYTALQEQYAVSYTHLTLPTNREV